MSDPALRHDGDRDGGHDRLDQVGVGHAGHGALLADVGGHALQGHHSGGARVLRDAGVFGRDDVHDHAALEHLGKAGLDLERAFDGAVSITRTVAFGHDRDSTPRCFSFTSQPLTRRDSASWVEMVVSTAIDTAIPAGLVGVTGGGAYWGFEA